MTDEPANPPVDWKAWALDMCELLDRIEQVADDAGAVRALAAGRHGMAERHGLRVEFGPSISGRVQ